MTSIYVLLKGLDTKFVLKMGALVFLCFVNLFFLHFMFYVPFSFCFTSECYGMLWQ